VGDVGRQTAGLASIFQHPVWMTENHSIAGAWWLLTHIVTPWRTSTSGSSWGDFAPGLWF